jgi:hypothetical protein
MSDTGIRAGVLEEAAELLERAVDQQDPELPAEILQRLLAASVRLFVARLERGTGIAPFPRIGSSRAPTATDVMVAATEFLAACEIELFELGMWQTWGGVGTARAAASEGGSNVG